MAPGDGAGRVRAVGPMGTSGSTSGNAAPAVSRGAAAVLIVLLLAAGAYFVWRLGWDVGTTGQQTVVIDQTERPRYNSQGLFKDPDGTIRGRAGDVILRAYPRSAGGYAIRVDFAPETRQSWVTPQQYDLHNQAVRILSYTRLAEYVQLSAEQRKELLALSADVPLSDEQRQRLESLISAWDKADGRAKGDARAEVLKALLEVGSTLRDATRQAMQHRVSRIPSILTEEQLAKARKWTPSLIPALPTSRPAAAGSTATRPAVPRLLGRTSPPATQPSTAGRAVGTGARATMPAAAP